MIIKDLTEHDLTNNRNSITYDEEIKVAERIEKEDRNMVQNYEYQERYLPSKNNFIKRNILIIEDNDVVSTILERFIKNAGYVPHLIKDGFEAFEFLVHGRDINYLTIKPSEVDFIILDLYLPNVSGNAILKDLKLKNNKVPIMIFSSDNKVSTIVKSIKKNGDANSFFRKKDILENKENLTSILKSIDRTFNDSTI
ncbi:response regulator [Rickettsiales bacterium]|nr:response regulator [Rickettsiales bacterium]MDB2550721.1 response regulator [Rickettsiales bacterium]